MTRKIILNTLGAFCAGGALGLLFGFGDYMGAIYCDLRAGLYMGAILAVAFSVACLIESLFNNQ